jgi:hypothetical protein
MTLIVTKNDLRHVVDGLVCPAHYYTIFIELLEVYDNNRDMTVDDMLKPFESRAISQQIPARALMRDPLNIRYSNYIIPLFYTAYVCKKEPSDRIIKEVLCAILREHGHFHYPESMHKDLKFQFGDEWNDPRHYWGFQYPKLTDAEIKQVANRYWDYVKIIVRKNKTDL